MPKGRPPGSRKRKRENEPRFYPENPLDGSIPPLTVGQDVVYLLEGHWIQPSYENEKDDLPPSATCDGGGIVFCKLRNIGKKEVIDKGVRHELTTYTLFAIEDQHTFEVSHNKIVHPAEFVIDRTIFEKSMARKWAEGDAVQLWFEDVGWSEGKICEIKSHFEVKSAELPNVKWSGWECLRIQWPGQEPDITGYCTWEPRDIPPVGMTAVPTAAAAPIVEAEPPKKKAKKAGKENKKKKNERESVSTKVRLPTTPTPAAPVPARAPPAAPVAPPARSPAVPTPPAAAAPVAPSPAPPAQKTSPAQKAQKSTSAQKAQKTTSAQKAQKTTALKTTSAQKAQKAQKSTAQKAQKSTAQKSTPTTTARKGVKKDPGQPPARSPASACAASPAAPVSSPAAHPSPVAQAVPAAAAAPPARKSAKSEEEKLRSKKRKEEKKRLKEEKLLRKKEKEAELKKQKAAEVARLRKEKESQEVAEVRREEERRERERQRDEELKRQLEARRKKDQEDAMRLEREALRRTEEKERKAQQQRDAERAAAEKRRMDEAEAEKRRLREEEQEDKRLAIQFSRVLSIPEKASADRPGDFEVPALPPLPADVEAAVAAQNKEVLDYAGHVNFLRSTYNGAVENVGKRFSTYQHDISFTPPGDSKQEEHWGRIYSQFKTVHGVMYIVKLYLSPRHPFLRGLPFHPRTEALQMESAGLVVVFGTNAYWVVPACSLRRRYTAAASPVIVSDTLEVAEGSLRLLARDRIEL